MKLGGRSRRFDVARRRFCFIAPQAQDRPVGSAANKEPKERKYDDAIPSHSQLQISDLRFEIRTGRFSTALVAVFNVADRIWRRRADAIKSASNFCRHC
jgi:hypothetical protein